MVGSSHHDTGPSAASGRGAPREQYERTLVLLPPGADCAWAEAVLMATWARCRYTVGGSADDAGIGDLDFRRVIAVNPEAWGDDLEAFFATHYPGMITVPVSAATPDTLKAALEVLAPPLECPPQPDPPRGLPRVQYERVYVLLPPEADEFWALSLMEGCWDLGRYTLGGSADDAGIGDLDARCVVAINPESWGDDLEGFFEANYPGVAYVPIRSSNLYQVRGRVGAFSLRRRGVSLDYPTTWIPPLVTDDFGVQRVSYFHNGLDLASSWERMGNEVLSATDGEVVVAGWNPSEPWFGFQVRVSSVLPDGRELLLRYAHLVSDEMGGVYVQQHQAVQRGQKLGRPDSTGVTASGEPSSTGDHLHFDVKVGGVYVDPAMLIDWPDE
jgi:hypothetical protein